MNKVFLSLFYPNNKNKLCSPQVLRIAERWQTNTMMAGHIYKNNDKLCRELNEFFGLVNNRYATNKKGEICIKHISASGDVVQKAISDDFLLGVIQYMRIKKK